MGSTITCLNISYSLQRIIPRVEFMHMELLFKQFFSHLPSRIYILSPVKVDYNNYSMNKFEKNVLLKVNLKK